ncbi:hypothetical protein HJB56_31095 [Rhizobium lentis]|uniref:Uncharacterized protein n=2 Tax=Rhizobium TaxID=379 RepID=A0A1L3ZHU9_RHILE|nr:MULTISPECIES: hypothetical protein [Rhizobium]NKL50669.1 hypothetical protein [Rhizobium leguminosarum bv. viciae]API55212.1 hypothetical protein BMW22_26915 [Rhizobium leguminosarum]MBX4925820.1 hypothetical protein [Rhizobium binae]MBX4996069.1 hypothetical protein [Rhizobium binae]MBX5020479.1 hypothetical protein [Rhizobium lentis]
MNRIVGSAAAIMLLFGLAPMALAQDGATQKQIDQRDPDFCGAGGAGCDPAEVQQWKAVGNKLADLSSADLSQYAYACAKHREWKRDCETDPVTILKRLGIEGY